LARRWKALLLALLPGSGHLYLGRHWRGLLVFAVFALGANGIYLATEFARPAMREQAVHLCAGAMAAAWAYSLLHVARLSGRFAGAGLRERKEYHLKRGLTQYVAGAFEGAEAEFLTVLRLDPADVDARFHLGVTRRAMGKTAQAARTFRRCLADDLDGKWRWEIGRELGRLRETK